MPWAIEVHREVAAWLVSLRESDYQHVLAALDALSVDGPALGRPFVDTVKGSAFANMKELRPRGGSLRLLFAFDPERKAIVLVAGDKAHRWSQWYAENVPLADERFSRHIENLASAGPPATGRTRRKTER